MTNQYIDVTAVLNDISDTWEWIEVYEHYDREALAALQSMGFIERGERGGHVRIRRTEAGRDTFMSMFITDLNNEDTDGA